MSHNWDNELTRAVADALEDREDEQSTRAAEWLTKHENDDYVWQILGKMLDRFTEIANAEREEQRAALAAELQARRVAAEQQQAIQDSPEEDRP